MNEKILLKKSFFMITPIKRQITQIKTSTQNLCNLFKNLCNQASDIVLREFFRDQERGIALIVTFMVIVVLTILGSATISRSVSERFIAQRYTESTQVFWLAEAGVNKALLQLKADFNNLNNIPATSLGQGEYSVDNIVIEGANRRVTAHGFVPSAAQPRAERSITVLVESISSNASNPELIDYAIETTGTFKITGSVDINPDGSSRQNSSLDFEEVFGMTKDEVKAIAVEAAAQGRGYVYTNPPVNQQPVNGITWVDLTGTNKYKISGNWSGSGLLIVNGTGDNIALEISGAWTFNGMIWVIGKVKISGTPVITGSIFAESAVDVESSLSGNATLNFNSADMTSAFSLLGGPTGLTVLSWREL